MIQKEIENGNMEIALWNKANKEVVLSVGGEKFSFSPQEGVLRPYRVGGRHWLPTLLATGSGKELLQKKEEAFKEEEMRAQVAYREAEEMRVAKMASLREEREVARVAQVAKDVPLVALFLQEYPEAREWVPSTGATFRELLELAVRHGLGRLVDRVRTGSYSSFSGTEEFWDAIYIVKMGGEEHEVRLSYVVED